MSVQHLGCKTSANLFWEHRIILKTLARLVPSSFFFFLHRLMRFFYVLCCRASGAGLTTFSCWLEVRQTVVRHWKKQASPTEIGLIELNYFMEWHTLT